MESTYNNPFLDYLYVQASRAYMVLRGPPDYKIRSKWIKNYIENSLYNIQKDMQELQDMVKSNPRINEIKSLSC